jgi:hypothetical protein
MDLTVLPMPGISDHNLAAGLHIDGRLGQVFQAIGFL